jgi:hypothetical protein
LAGFDARKFERDLRKAIEKPASDGMREIANDLKGTFDVVHQTHRGKPLAET